MPDHPFLSLRRKPLSEARSGVGDRASRPRRWRTRLLMGGVVALPLGALLGYLAQPDFGAPQRAMPAAAAPRMPLMLEVRRSDPVAPVAGAATVRGVDTPPEIGSNPGLPPPPPPLPPALRSSPAVAPPIARADPDASATGSVLGPGPGAGPSFNCRYARSGAEQMVCREPQLAAADRRLNDAFEQAIAAGAPRRMLRLEQDDWLQIREDAARMSPRAVGQIYEQRIGELLEMARNPG